MRLVIVITRESKVRHIAVESGMRTRSLCGQVQHQGAVPSVASIRGTWDIAVDADGTRTGHRELCKVCTASWDREWVPWIAAIHAGVEPMARRASS